jgi:hypothetical protein
VIAEEALELLVPDPVRQSLAGGFDRCHPGLPVEPGQFPDQVPARPDGQQHLLAAVGRRQHSEPSLEQKVDMPTPFAFAEQDLAVSKADPGAELEDVRAAPEGQRTKERGVRPCRNGRVGASGHGSSI